MSPNTLDPSENPLRQSSRPDTYWTTVNTAEAMPGVLTPLGWSFFGGALEPAMRGSFVDLGVLERRKLPTPPAPDERFTAIFYGRVAANVDLLRDVVGDRMPGTSADALELQLLGSVRVEGESHPTRRRYAAVAARGPFATAMLARRLQRVRRGTDAWWRSIVLGPTPSSDQALTLLQEAFERFGRIMRLHSFSSFICQGAYDQVAKLAEQSGHPGLERRLVSGYGGMEETTLAADLWQVSRGALALGEFVARHGYHGPAEGEISSRPWRENPGPLTDAVARFKDLDESQDPRRTEERLIRERGAAEEEICARKVWVSRTLDRVVLGMARRYVPLREVGKAAFLQALDVGRFAARAIGADLERRDLIDQTDDIFFLTVDELRMPLDMDLRPLINERRAQRERYLTLELPDSWTGNPEPRVAGGAFRRETLLTGVAASAGAHVGTARVVSDPAEAELQEGDVLVCETTDPSWALLFVTVGALVVDIGGPLSHGAIVAREMGIPCVINTRDGTRAIADGDRLRVDGDAGTVEILTPIPQPTGASQ